LDTKARHFKYLHGNTMGFLRLFEIHNRVGSAHTLVLANYQQRNLLENSQGVFPRMASSFEGSATPSSPIHCLRLKR
jgi:hypothetical protein